MALTDTQLRQLKAKLDPRYVKTRRANGHDLSYIEGWHAISEANRIFGFDAWDRQTLESACVWSGLSGEYFLAAYTAKVRISVRAGDVTVTRDGSGSGEGKAPTRGQAHELALKGAETDATKRALMTFGNPFGLALYDPEQAGVRKSRNGQSKVSGPWVLHGASGAEEATFEKPSEFSAALRKAMDAAPDIEALFAVWEQNVEAVRSINRALKQGHLPRSGVAPQLVEHLKRCAVALANSSVDDAEAASSAPKPVKSGGRHKVDKSALAIGEPRRIRDKEHLRYVASQPCTICGRMPSHAHHVRHAQTRGLGLKVSDEFTVPLCAAHHDEIHRTLREKAWWQERNVDPLVVAAALWRESRGLRSTQGDTEPASAPTAEPGTSREAGEPRL